MRFLLVPLLISAGTLPFTGGADKKERLKPINLHGLNSETDETDPGAPDDLNLLYASNRSGRWEIMSSKRTKTGAAWPAGKSLLSDKEADLRSPFLRAGVLFYATNKVTDEKLSDLKNFDILRKANDLAPLPLLGISEKEDELNPWVTPGGKEFYFSRKQKDGWMLFIAQGPTPGPIGKATLVGFPAGFHHAALGPSTLVMYLEGPMDDGRTGLFRSRRTRTGAPWSKPEPLAQLSHSEGKLGDLAPCVSADGTRLYFASDRPGGKGGLDLWSILVAELK